MATSGRRLGTIAISQRAMNEPITPSWQFIRVENADQALEEMRARGAKIVEEIASHPWGMREFTVEDPNGHRFRIGHSEGPVQDPA